MNSYTPAIEKAGKKVEKAAFGSLRRRGPMSAFWRSILILAFLGIVVAAIAWYTSSSFQQADPEGVPSNPTEVQPY